MNLLERYNALLRSTENDTITRLNRVLDASFNRLVRRTRIHIKAGYADPARRNLALLQDFRQLIPAISPERGDAYDRLFRSLLESASGNGLASAEELTDRAALRQNRVDVTIPLEATAAAVKQSRQRLAKHGDRFAETGAQLIAQGIAEGRPTPAMVTDLRTRLGLVKSRAETIVRTESLRAYNTASDRYYASQNIELVLFYATADDRSCPICAPRAGLIYKRGTISTPLHPRCRCYLAPWSETVANLDPEYAAMRQTHKEEVNTAVRYPNTDLLNKKGIFETLNPTPLNL